MSLLNNLKNDEKFGHFVKKVYYLVDHFKFLLCQLLTCKFCWTTFCATNTFSKFIPLAHPCYILLIVLCARGERRERPPCLLLCAKNIFYCNNTFPPLCPSAPLIPISLFFTPLFARPRRALAAFMIYIKLFFDQKLNCSLPIKNYCCLIG